MKHLALDYHFVRENVQVGCLTVFYISTTDQLVDALTKPLSRTTFRFLITKLVLSNTWPFCGGMIRIKYLIDFILQDYSYLPLTTLIISLQSRIIISLWFFIISNVYIYLPSLPPSVSIYNVHCVFNNNQFFPILYGIRLRLLLRPHASISWLQTLPTKFPILVIPSILLLSSTLKMLINSPLKIISHGNFRFKLFLLVMTF